MTSPVTKNTHDCSNSHCYTNIANGKICISNAMLEANYKIVVHILQTVTFAYSMHCLELIILSKIVAHTNHLARKTDFGFNKQNEHLIT